MAGGDQGIWIRVPHLVSACAVAPRLRRLPRCRSRRANRASRRAQRVRRRPRRTRRRAGRARRAERLQHSALPNRGAPQSIHSSPRREIIAHGVARCRRPLRHTHLQDGDNWYTQSWHGSPAVTQSTSRLCSLRSERCCPRSPRPPKTSTAPARCDPHVIARLHDAGYFALLQPPSFGGLDAHPDDYLTATRELSAACMSTGWLAAWLGGEQLGTLGARRAGAAGDLGVRSPRRCCARRTRRPAGWSGSTAGSG